MRKRNSLIAAVLGLLASLGAGWWFHRNFEIRGLENIRVVERGGQARPRSEVVPVAHETLPVERAGDTIRVASFNLHVFGAAKASKPEVLDILARVIRRFDVIAVQEIRALDQSLLPQFVDFVNSAGRQYDYVVGPRLGRTDSKEQYAFVFDRASVEVDRTQLYTIADPEDMLHREPLVGWFRVRGPPANAAFTFTLVNMHTDPDEAAQEISVLDDVFRLVRDDGRNEDDVILLGDFNANDRALGELGAMPGARAAIMNLPTNTRGTAQYDNIVFQEPATSEFTGRAGVFDFLREYNLTVEQALEVSDHLPVWAEFSAHEGGQGGRVASR